LVGGGLLWRNAAYALQWWVFALFAAYMGWSLPRMILTMLSGFVPVMPFIVERKVAGEVEAQLAGSLAP